DLWKYTISSNEWTWVSGDSGYGSSHGLHGVKGVGSATTIPGGRSDFIAWADQSGLIWLFGGYGLDAKGSTGRQNDLWQYNPVNNIWTWVGGDSVELVPPSYGTLYKPSLTNKPGDRTTNTGWIDKSGNLWLLGGFCILRTTGGYCNDLWKYNIAANEWTWMSGSDSTFQNGIYGTQGIPDSANTPGAREYAMSWTDSNGDFWLYGGYNYGTSANVWNDLWKYSVATSEWTWVGGSNISNPASVSSTPDARNDAGSWTDNNGVFWLYGGSNNNGKMLADLWGYTPPAN